MSYRSFKHLLGETSLERKCRFIFGGGILLLVTFSFYWYGQQSESLVLNQTTQQARMLVNPTIKDLHHKSLGNVNFEAVFDAISADLAPLDDLPKYDWNILKPYAPEGSKNEPVDDFERDVLNQFMRSAATEASDVKAGKPRQPYVFSDGSRMWNARIAQRKESGKREYQYVQAILYKSGCLSDCHGNDGNHIMRQASIGKWVAAKPGDLAGAVVIKLPMDQTEKALHHNRAILITAALVTATLAMMALYVVIRYVIVIPTEQSPNVSFE